MKTIINEDFLPQFSEEAFSELYLSTGNAKFNPDWFRIYSALGKRCSIKTYSNFPDLLFLFYESVGIPHVAPGINFDLVILRRGEETLNMRNEYWKAKAVKVNPVVSEYEPVGEANFVRPYRKLHDVYSCILTSLLKIVTPHITLSSVIQGKGLALSLYALMHNQGYTLVTDSHTADAINLWERVARLVNTPVLYLLHDVEPGEPYILVDKPNKETIKVLLGKNVLLDPNKVQDNRHSKQGKV